MKERALGRPEINILDAVIVPTSVEFFLPLIEKEYPYPNDFKYPFFRQVKENSRSLNIGASTCLIAYIISPTTVFEGHFTHVRPPCFPDTAIEPFRKFITITRKLTQHREIFYVALLAQHFQVNSTSQFPHNFFTEEMWIEEKDQVIADLANSGVASSQIVDLRSQTYGCTNVLFDSNPRRLQYVDFTA